MQVKTYKILEDTIYNAIIQKLNNCDTDDTQPNKIELLADYLLESIMLNISENFHFTNEELGVSD